MARLFPAITLSNLKSIDPFDCLGNGSNVLSIKGDRAVVFNHDTRMIFYSLEERTGGNNVDIGFEEIVPTSNPGDFYWKCRGFTKSTFTGVLSGESFITTDLENSSKIPPDGFTGGIIDYSLDVYTAGMLRSEDSDDISWWGTGFYGDYMYVVTSSDYVKLEVNNDLSIAQTNTYVPITNYVDEYFWFNPTWCKENPLTEHFICDIGSFINDPTVLQRFNMITGLYDHINITFPGDWQGWAIEYPNPGVGFPIYGHRIQIGRTIYMMGGDYYREANKMFKIDVLTGVMTRLAILPNSYVAKCGAVCADYDNEQIYFLSLTDTVPLLRYNIGSDTWDVLASGGPSNTIYDNHICWWDSINEQLVIPSTLTWLWDKTLNTWISYPQSTGWVNRNNSCVVFDRDVGAIWPCGYKEGVSYYNGIISINRPLRFTKT